MTLFINFLIEIESILIIGNVIIALYAEGKTGGEKITITEKDIVIKMKFFCFILYSLFNMTKNFKIRLFYNTKLVPCKHGRLVLQERPEVDFFTANLIVLSKNATEFYLFLRAIYIIVLIVSIKSASRGN